MSSKFNENLVNEAKNGNPQAFAELYSQYAEDMFRFAYYYLGSHHRAEDCVSEAVLLAYRKVGTLRKAASFKSWLFKILRNCCNAALREKIEGDNILELSEATYRTASQGDLDSTIALCDILAQLPPRDREIILMYYCHDYTSKEIAHELDLNHSTVRTRIRRTTEKLRELLDI